VSAQEQLKYNFHKNLNEIQLDTNLNKSKMYLNNVTIDDKINFYENETNNYLLENSKINYFIRNKNKKIAWSEFDFADINLSALSDDFKNPKLYKNDALNGTRAAQVAQHYALNSFFKKTFNETIDSNIFFKYNDFAVISR